MKKRTEKIKLVFTVLILAFVPCLHAAIDWDIYESIDITEGDYFRVSIWGNPEYPFEQTIVSMYDGSISYLASFDDSILNVYGGTVSGRIGAGDNSTVSLHGGNIVQAWVDDTATLNIYGYGFEIESIADVHTLLTGYWFGGTEFSILFYREKVLPEQVSLLPEPASLFLALTGLGLLRLKCKSNTI